MTDCKWTKANRLSEITEVRIVEEKVGSAPGYEPEFLSKQSPDFSHLKAGDSLWLVWTTLRTGLDKETRHVMMFLTREKAEEHARAEPVGKVLGGEIGFPMRFKDFFGNAPDGKLSTELLSWFFGCGDHDAVHFACYEALSEAGVKSRKDYQTSKKVLEWLGDEHVDWMRVEFGENWSVVAELEYCVCHFPKSSLATLAAKLFLAQFVTYDDFAAGYLTKEIEAISGGTEEAAHSSVQAKQKAGKAGGDASRRRRLQNLERLMREVEALSDAATLMGEKLIVQKAWENATTKYPDMPTSKPTFDDYSATLRVDEPFRTRYRAVFPKSP